MADEDSDGRERELFEAELRKRQDELEVLMDMGREAGFTPRASIARTPPSGTSAPLTRSVVSAPPPSEAAVAPAMASANADGADDAIILSPLAAVWGVVAGEAEVARSSKRQFSSPEEVQDRIRRCMERRGAARSAVPPIGGILTKEVAAGDTQPVVAPPAPEVSAAGSQWELAAMSKIQLLDTVQQSLKGIVEMANSTAGTNKYKLNGGERQAICDASQKVLAVVATLELRLAEAENKVAAVSLQNAQMELKMMSLQAGGTAAPSAVPQAQGPTYASLLKRPIGQPSLAITAKPDQAVLFYPNSETIKTSEETKAELQKSVRPGTMGIQVQSVRRIGNSGIVVKAATSAGAEKLKAAAPSTLKTAAPKSRQPLVALRNLRSDPNSESPIEELQATNLAEDPMWPLSKVKSSCRVAFKKRTHGGHRTTVILECSSELRDKLVDLGTVYVGWDEAEVMDHLKVTCCRKCHQYGHPEKYCRSKEMVCGRCGDAGHKREECQAKSECCATCRRFKRKDASMHSTGSPSCPARIFAEQQAANMTHYG